MTDFDRWLHSVDLFPMRYVGVGITALTPPHANLQTWYGQGLEPRFAARRIIRLAQGL